MKLKNTYIRILIFSFIIFSIIGFKKNTETEKSTDKSQYQILPQTHPIADMIANKKQGGASFASFSVFSLNSEASPASLSSFTKSAAILKLNFNSLTNLFNTKPNNLEFIIPLNGNKNFELELTQVNLFTEDFAKKNSFRSGIYYQGIIKGDQNSIASVSIFGNWVE